MDECSCLFGRLLGSGSFRLDRLDPLQHFSNAELNTNQASTGGGGARVLTRSVALMSRSTMLWET